MNKKTKGLLLILLTFLLAGCRSNPASPAVSPSAATSPAVTQTSVTPSPAWSPTATNTPEIPLAATMVPLAPTNLPWSTSAKYSVLPILFVPSDLKPDLYAAAAINRVLQKVQRWYAEQLRGATFTLEPTLVLRGTRTLKEYYGSCYPPLMACDWGYKLYDSISRDLQVLGYAPRDTRLVSVHFQNEGMGGTALGGGNLAVGGITLLTDFDILSIGGTAHEIGHSLGLPHPKDVNGEYGTSLMGVGFYNFPRTTFVDSEKNPERTRLLASPFINFKVPLADGGFEDCDSRWMVKDAMVDCLRDGQQSSGLSALRLIPEQGRAASISQAVTLTPGGAYDITGWGNSVNSRVSIRVRASDSDGTLIEDALAAAWTLTAARWEKIGGIYRAPAGAAKFEMVIAVEAGGSGFVILDDFAVQESTAIPGATLPAVKNSGETVTGSEPLLQWLDNPNTPVYQIQIDLGTDFYSPLLNRYVSSPYYQVEAGLLETGKTYSWRICAGNAAGWSVWSPEWQMALRPEGEYTGDEFDYGTQTMDPGWSWIRENPATWGFNGYPSTPYKGYLNIDIRGGDLAGTINDAPNILVRTPRSGDWAIDSLVEIWGLLWPEGQEAGMMLYRDDDNYCTMGRIIDETGYHMQWACEIGGQLTVYDQAWAEGGLPIRIQRTGTTYRAWYSVNGLEWRPMANPVSLDWTDMKIALYAYGPIDSVEPSTAYFNYFRYAFPT